MEKRDARENIGMITQVRESSLLGAGEGWQPKNSSKRLNRQRARRARGNNT